MKRNRLTDRLTNSVRMTRTNLTPVKEKNRNEGKKKKKEVKIQ